MSGKYFTGLLILVLAFGLSGCVARTYNLTRDRIDQDLVSGNRGYLQGTAPETDESLRDKTRDVRVVEIELGFKRKPTAPKTSAVTSEPVSYEEPGPSFNESLSTESSASMQPSDFEEYTVQKNDTLQKISQKYYGTTKNWYKLYKANQDVLKGPDKLYPGQVIKIPALGTQKPEVESMAEPAENLK